MTFKVIYIYMYITYSAGESIINAVTGGRRNFHLWSRRAVGDQVPQKL